MKLIIDVPEEYYDAIKQISDETSTADMLIIKNGKPLNDELQEIKQEIEEKYDGCDICEWFEDYDYEENDISEYQQVGKVSDILSIIDKYREGGCVNVSIRK